jgi:hypothetical protein
VAKKALAGMFSLVETKEKDIRSNPKLSTSELLKKVFAQQEQEIVISPLFTLKFDWDEKSAELSRAFSSVSD